MSEVAHNFDNKQVFSEKWLPISGYDGNYEVSDCGRVRSLKFGKSKLLKSYVARGGYLIVTLCKSSIRETFTIHRLVASAFIPNPESLPEVDHIDANRQNNNVSNLRWVSHKENISHAGKLGNMARSLSQHHCWDSAKRGGKKSGRIIDDLIMFENMKDKKIESKSFPEIWSVLNGEERNELARRLYHAGCCSTYQTIWNWATGKVRPQSILVRKEVAKVVGKFIDSQVITATLFPHS